MNFSGSSLTVEDSSATPHIYIFLMPAHVKSNKLFFIVSLSFIHHPLLLQPAIHVSVKQTIHVNKHNEFRHLHIHSTTVSRLKDTSTPPGWCRPCGSGYWGWGRTELWAACCWWILPAFCFWHTAASSSVPVSLQEWVQWCKPRAVSSRRALPRCPVLGEPR